MGIKEYGAEAPCSIKYHFPPFGCNFVYCITEPRYLCRCKTGCRSGGSVFSAGDFEKISPV